MDLPWLHNQLTQTGVTDSERSRAKGLEKNIDHSTELKGLVQDAEGAGNMITLGPSLQDDTRSTNGREDRRLPPMRDLNLNDRKNLRLPP